MLIRTRCHLLARPSKTRLKEEKFILMVGVKIFEHNGLFYNAMTGSSEAGEEIEDLMCLDLTHEEIKAAFR